MISLAAGYASFLYFFPGTVQRIGATLTLAGYLYCGLFQFRRRFPTRKIPDAPASAICAAYRIELERKLEFGRTAWRTFLLVRKKQSVVKRPPSPSDIRGVTPRAQTSSRYGNRRATCVCGRWPVLAPRSFSGTPGPSDECGRPRL
jgi:hypothetical protein